MFKIGLSSKSNVFSDELFSSYASAGVSMMEISNCTEGYDAIDFEAVKRMADKHGVTLWSLHLPFKTHDGVSHEIANPEVCKIAVEDQKRLIRKGAAIGIKNFILHPSSAKVPEGKRREWIETCKRSLIELSEYARELGAVIAVENMTHDCLGNTISEFEELVSHHPTLRVCFDTNHLLYESPVDFIKRFKDRIVTLHVSDCNLEIEQHSLPGEGKIDFQTIITALREIDYRGPWLYEVSYKCPQPKDDKHKLTCESFVKNANEIFSGKTPTRQR